MAGLQRSAQRRTDAVGYRPGDSHFFAGLEHRWVRPVHGEADLWLPLLTVGPRELEGIRDWRSILREVFIYAWNRDPSASARLAWSDAQFERGARIDLRWPTHLLPARR